MEFTLIPNGDNGHEKTLKKIAQQWSKYVVIKTSQKKSALNSMYLYRKKKNSMYLKGRGLEYQTLPKKGAKEKK